MGRVVISCRPDLRDRATSVAVAAVTIALLFPLSAEGQRPSDGGDVRVVETVDPVSGARYRQAVYDLTKKEIKAVQRALRGDGLPGRRLDGPTGSRHGESVERAPGGAWAVPVRVCVLRDHRGPGPEA